MKTANAFLVFPPEVWVMILKKLPTHYHVETMCIAFEELKEFIGTYLLEWKQREALKCVLGNDIVEPTHIVAIRQTCKKWRDIFDEFCDKPYSIQKRPLWAIPHVSITLPLDEAGILRVRQLADYNENPFVGGRLSIQLNGQLTAEEIGELRQLFEETKRIGRHVKHLVITVNIEVIYDLPHFPYRGPDGFCNAIVYPRMIEMTQVVSITCNVPSLGADVVAVLPNPEQVESLFVINFSTPWDVDETADWRRLLEQCCSNLKWFYVDYMGYDLQEVLDGMRFANVERFVVKRFAACWDDEGQFPLELITSNRFPNLQELGIPFENGLYDGRRGAGKEDEEEGECEETCGECDETTLSEYDGREAGKEEEGEDEETCGECDETTLSEDGGSEAREEEEEDEDTLLARNNNVLYMKDLVRMTHRMHSLKTIYLYRGEVSYTGGGFPISDCSNRGASAVVTTLEFPNICMKGSWSWIKAVGSYFPALRSISLKDGKMSMSKGGQWNFVVGRVD